MPSVLRQERSVRSLLSAAALLPAGSSPGAWPGCRNWGSTNSFCPDIQPRFSTPSYSHLSASSQASLPWILIITVQVQPIELFIVCHLNPSQPPMGINPRLPPPLSHPVPRLLRAALEQFGVNGGVAVKGGQQSAPCQGERLQFPSLVPGRIHLAGGAGW